MKTRSWKILLAVSLLLSSVLIFLIQVVLFHDARDTVFYLLQDLAFIPVQVLLVTLILNRFLEHRDKSTRLNRMNMAIGVFFSECGNPLLKSLSAFDSRSAAVRDLMQISAQWTAPDFDRVLPLLQKQHPDIDCSRSDLTAVRHFLLEKRPFLLSLLENSNLLEHDAFADLLWAVFHLAEELGYRPHVATLSKADSEHLAKDIARVNTLLYVQWMAYLRHLKEQYPYLFSLAVRMNPLNPTANAEVR